MLDTCSCVISCDPSSGKSADCRLCFGEGSKLLLCLTIPVKLVTMLDWLVVAVCLHGARTLSICGDSNCLKHVNDTDFNYLLCKAHLTTSYTGANENSAIENIFVITIFIL